MISKNIGGFPVFLPLPQFIHSTSSITLMIMLTMYRPCCFILLLLGGASGFLVGAPPRQAAQVKTLLQSSKGADDSEPPPQQPALNRGTIVEFEEKKREHVGVISDVQHKANGAVRYEVVEGTGEGKQTKHSIADKAVHFSVNAPNNDKQAEKLLADLEEAHEEDEVELARDLDVSPELLGMVWEEAVEDESHDEAVIDPAELVEMVHSKKATGVEKYKAWRLLKSEIGHVFFKDVKERGRVTAFKAKPASSVEASKEAYCAGHPGDAMCQIDEADDVLGP